jgi:hypothetical protein
MALSNGNVRVSMALSNSNVRNSMAVNVRNSMAGKMLTGTIELTDKAIDVDQMSEWKYLWRR